MQGKCKEKTMVDIIPNLYVCLEGLMLAMLNIKRFEILAHCGKYRIGGVTCTFYADFELD